MFITYIFLFLCPLFHCFTLITSETLLSKSKIFESQDKEFTTQELLITFTKLKNDTTILKQDYKEVLRDNEVLEQDNKFWQTAYSELEQDNKKLRKSLKELTETSSLAEENYCQLLLHYNEKTTIIKEQEEELKKLRSSAIGLQWALKTVSHRIESSEEALQRKEQENAFLTNIALHAEMDGRDLFDECNEVLEQTRKDKNQFEKLIKQTSSIIKLQDQLDGLTFKNPSKHTSESSLTSITENEVI